MVEESRPARATSSDADSSDRAAARPAPPARTITFDELWEGYRRLKAVPTGPAGVLSRVDPAVFVIRRRILADCLKGLLVKSPRIRALSMDHKKLLARHLSSTVWKGYLLALAYEERLGGGRTGRSILDHRYLTGVFSGLMKDVDGWACLDGVDPCVSQGLAQIQVRDAEKLSDQLAAAGAARSASGPAGEDRLLFAALGGLALMGFMVWKAQLRALGAES